MSKAVILALAAAATSLANAAVAVASEYGGENVKCGETPAAPEETTEAPKSGGRRGRPAAEKPAEEETAAKSSGKTLEELKALIDPLVKGTQGPDVKKIIAKYTDGKLADIAPKDHDAFVKDIEAISY